MKLNNLSRLTALLLALTMILSSVAWAAPVTEGDFTFDNYEEMLAAQTGTCETCASALGYFPETDQFGNPIEITCVYEYLLSLGGTQNQYDFIKFLYDDIRTEWSTFMGEYDDHMRAGDAPILCSCKSLTSDPPVPGDGTHAEDCPWYEMTTVDPTDPDQPPLYNGNPQGKQYTETLEYTVSELEGRAVILQTGARAILTSESTTPGVWQVYTGNEWVDIQGDNTNVIEVTEAKLNTIFELTGVAQLRYFDKANSVVLDEVAATTKEIAGGEYPAQVAQEVPQVLKLVSRAVSEDERTITVHFRFADGSAVKDSVVGEFALNKPANWDVPVDAKQGYDPTFENQTGVTLVSEGTGYKLVIALDTITDNLEYVVVYQPANVGYQVNHYLQPVSLSENSEEYVLRTPATPRHDGYTGQPIEATLKADEKQEDGKAKLHIDIPGFINLPYSIDFSVAETGNTTVEIYYDRLYYLMKFDLGGGYGVEPIYAAYGTSLTGLVVDPERPGYTFDGWKLQGDTTDKVYSSAEIAAGTMPYENVTYVAQWTPVSSAKVTIVFWGENADDEDYSYLSSSTVNVAPGTKVHFSGNGLTTCGYHVHDRGCYELICTEVPHSHDACELACTHPHDENCYESDYGLTTSTPSSTMLSNLSDSDGDGIWTYTEEGWLGDTNYYYVKIGDVWYSGKNRRGNASNTAEITYVCPHTHTDRCYKCGIAANSHVHSALTGSCYRLDCTEPVHTHTNNCYVTVARPDSSLWTLVEADVVTVAADGSTVVNVYYDRTSFTLTFRRNSNTVKTIHEKWGADIHDEFPIRNGENTMWWTVPSGATTMKPNTQFGSLDTMPAENITFTYDDETKAATLHYYVEALPDEDGKTATEIYSGFTSNNYNGIDGSKKFKTYKNINVTTSGRLTYTEEFHNIIGFRQYVSYPKFDKHEQGGTTNDIKTNNYLLYVRNAFDIVYYSPTDLLDTIENVPYQMPLNSATYNWTPTTPPAKYEPGSVRFAGWYLNPECSGQPFDFTTATMPAGPTNTNGEVALSLYAKWVPVIHTVKVYNDKGGTQLGETQNVAHGSFATEPASVSHPSGNTRYEFAGWFYEETVTNDDGTTTTVEKAFDFANVPVRKDLTIYAKWSSKVLVNYTVRYVLAIDETVEVAEPLQREGLAGSGKTFEAKTGEELKDGYKTGYYPIRTSEHLDFEIGGENELVFKYAQADKVPYTVYYVTKEPNTNSATPVTINGDTYYVLTSPSAEEAAEHAENKNAVVTESYKPVTGYRPREYQKTLVLSVNADGEPNTAANTMIFVYDEDPTSRTYYIEHYVGPTVNGEWTLYGDPEPRPGNVGEHKNAAPVRIPGYDHDPTITGTISSGTIPDQGTLTMKLYYVEKQATINYEVVGPTGVDVSKVGTVTINKTGEVAGTKVSETVKIKNGTAWGATAAEMPNDKTYEFVGWYTKDANGDYKEVLDANGKHITTPEFTPTKEDEELWIDGTTYYALFEYNVSDLTVEKKNMDPGESAVVQVVINGTDGEETYTIVLNNGAPSATIKDVLIGSTYTVTELDAWTWRYSNGSVEYKASKDSEGNYKIVADPSTNTVTVTNSKSTNQWLSDESAVKNDLGVPSKTGYYND